MTATKRGQKRQLEQLDFSDEMGDLCMMLGPIAVECYVAEVPIEEALSGTSRISVLRAIAKERQAVHDRRFTPAVGLTAWQKKGALKCRYSITQKRLSPEQEMAGALEGLEGKAGGLRPEAHEACGPRQGVCPSARLWRFSLHTGDSKP